MTINQTCRPKQQSQTQTLCTDNLHALNQQIAALQMHLSYLEDTVNQLDAALVAQDKRVELQNRKLQRLIGHIRKLDQTDAQSAKEAFDPHAEVPPHY